jgi:hypothetical protein
MGGIHLGQGLLMILLALTLSQFDAFKIQLVQFFLEFTPSQGLALTTNPTEVFQLPFGIAVAIFLLISAFAHALVSIPKKTNGIYVADLKKGINKFRWYEYALSSSVMIVLIATLFGVRDFSFLIVIFMANAGMNLFGLDMEEMNSGFSKDKPVNWKPFIWGSVVGLAPWVAIVLFMSASPNLDQTPWFVWAILVSYFFAFNTFPINMILQYLRVGKWKDYLYGERVYITLSLVAKTILAWLVFAGALQPN